MEVWQVDRRPCNVLTHASLIVHVPPPTSTPPLRRTGRNCHRAWPGSVVSCRVMPCRVSSGQYLVSFEPLRLMPMQLGVQTTVGQCQHSVPLHRVLVQNGSKVGRHWNKAQPPLNTTARLPSTRSLEKGGVFALHSTFPKIHHLMPSCAILIKIA